MDSLVHTTLVTFSYLVISDWNDYSQFWQMGMARIDKITRTFLEWLELPIKANVQGHHDEHHVYECVPCSMERCWTVSCIQL